MSAHESMEQADHAKEAARREPQDRAADRGDRAVSGAVGNARQGRADRIDRKNVEASNLWAFFQAKSIRRTTVQTAAEQAKLGLGSASDDATKAAVQKQIDDWQKTAARYRSEPETGEGTEQLAERAKHAEEERDLADGEVSSLRAGFRGVPDRHRAGFGDHHHRHHRAGLDLGPADAGRHRIHRARHLRAASAALP